MHLQRLVGRWMLVGMVGLMTLVGCSAAPQSGWAPAADSAPMAAEQPPAAGAAGAPADGGESLALVPGQELPASMARKIIATANIHLVAANTNQTIDEITALMDEIGGYVANANFYRTSFGDGEMMQGTMTLRVPADRLEETMERLEALAVDVPSKTLEREDVTDQYSDVEAQLRNLEATETELRALLAEVRERPNATPEDILAVHRSITEVRGQIEQLQGRKNVLDNLIGLSTIHVTLTPDAANLPVVEEGWRPAVVARDATRALTAALQGLGNLVIWMGIFLLPLVLMALLVLSILLWVVRGILRWLSRRTAKRAANVTV